MAGSNHERVLAAEWLVVMGVQTLDALSGADSGSFALPDPSRYFASMVVFLMLAAAAMFGDKPGRLAAAFGGVAGLGILLYKGHNTQPPVIGALNYFDKLMKGGPAGSPSSSGVQNPSTAPGFGSVPATGKTPGYNFAPVPAPVNPTGGTSAVAPGGFQGR